MLYDLQKLRSNEDWQAYHQIRRAVLWEARGQTDYDDQHSDEFIKNNHPLLLRFQNIPIGTARLDDFGNGTGAIRLVAIALNAQNRGHGRRLVELVEHYAKGLSLHTLFVNAAPNAVGFYKNLGWEYFLWTKMEIFGITSDCQQMRKLLN